MIKDLTVGSPFKLILLFCLPLLLGNILQQLYNMVDAIIVGQFISMEALAAVGSTGAVSFFVIGFILGMCSGFCIPVAQAFGAGNEKELRRLVVNASYLSVIFGIVITAGSMLTTKQLLVLMQTPPEIINDAYTYIIIIFAGIPATILYNLLSGIMRSLGDSKTPLIFLAIAAILNIVLDLLFVLVIPMGVAGAAVATVISQIVSGVLCWIYMKKRFPILKIQKDETGFNLALSKRLVFSGIPMALQFSITAIGSIILQSAVNTLGTGVVAAVTAANKVQSFVHLPLSTIGIAMATYCGQNLGAERLDRVKKGVNIGSLITAIYCIVIMIIIFFWGQYISLLFINKNDMDILVYVDRFLKICSIFYVPLGLIMVYRNAIQGLEFGIPAMLAGLFELIGRGVICFSLLDIIGFDAVCIASPVAWIAANIFLIPFYYLVLHKIKKRLSLQTINTKINFT